jgi:hypothetical protein
MTHSPFRSGFYPGAAARRAFRSGVITPATAIGAAGGSTLTIRHHRICTARSIVVTHRTYTMTCTATTRTRFSTETWHLSCSLGIDVIHEERGKSITCTPCLPPDSAPNDTAGIRAHHCYPDSGGRMWCCSCRTGRRPCAKRPNCRARDRSSDKERSQTLESPSAD